MGILYNQEIDNYKNKINYDDTFFTYISMKSISFGKNGKMGILPIPNASACLYQSTQLQYISIAFDGKINNRNFLVRDLKLFEKADIGHIVEALYHRYSKEGLYRLEGAFSLILHDEKLKITILYRSFMTGYPLYYISKNNLLTVSTNPVYLLHRPDVSDSLNKQQMYAWFSFQLSSWTDTVFSDLSEVEHGEMVIVSSHGIHSQKRSLSDMLPTSNYVSEIDAINTYRSMADRTIRKNILPNVRHGILLSSGMDSSTIAYFASKYLQKSGNELRAYSWSLPNYPEADETEQIKKLCDYLSIKLTLFDGEAFAPFSKLDDFELQPDIPFSNLYTLMTSQVMKLAAGDNVTALLSGHRGDHLFHSTQNLFIDIIKDKKFQELVPNLKMIIDQMGYRQLFRSPAILAVLKHYLPVTKFRKKHVYIPDWINPEIKNLANEVKQFKLSDLGKEHSAFATVLEKRNTSSGRGRYYSGKYGIEILEPFHDPELFNYTLRLPSYLSYKNGQSKYFAREAMRELLPESIRTQAKVGLLEKFAMDSFIKNKEKVREKLFDDTSSWNVYVDEKWMQHKFTKYADVKEIDLLVIWSSLNIGPWQKAIKPGGSLYEGDFMQKNSKGMK